MSQPSTLPTTLGGQAVIEGVMIRGPRGTAVCVRKPDGEIAVRTELNESGGRLSAVPVLRGIAALGETLTQGMRALVWSGQIAAGEEPEEPSRSQVLLTTAMSLGAMSALFILAPALAARRLERRPRFQRLSAAIEGGLRVGTLIGYLRTIGRLPQAKRLFGYHGAEHRAIQAYEAGEPLETASLHHFPNAHVRCGTSFLLTTTIMSSAVYAALGPQPLGRRILSRLILTPVIAGLSYEAIRLGAASSGRFWQLIFRPNLALQSLTTRDPDEGQMEVALAAVRAALDLHTPA
ncbi:MAG: DUF1385 domain-containing protein [Chloroflexi bacterium]|nr:DUF1385 domain-containing protein [Chloroflexota bacterium]